MKKIKLLLTGLAVSVGLSSPLVQAALSEEDLAKLGTTHTLWGAEIAGTADGEYPAYEGGIEPPANFDPDSGQWPDPFPEDKPLFSIDSSNMEEHKDRLTEGVMELMRRYPTYRMDIYPTRRAVHIPEYHANSALENAKNPECKTVGNGVGLRGCWGGTPFPIPKNGYEAMWNHLLTLNLPGHLITDGYLVDANGAMTRLVVSDGHADTPYNNPDQKPYEGSGKYYLRSMNLSIEPARQAGTQTLLWFPLMYDTDNSRAWNYQPGLRRVRMAPEFSYDTPVAQNGGTMFFDEIGIFNGRMDRFNFELKGKKLMYMPYNQHRFHEHRGDPSVMLDANHVNPDHFRYELRRVWVVEATPHEGVRHVAKKKLFYLDEDSWAALAYEGWDNSDKLFRVIHGLSMTNYYKGGVVLFTAMIAYDLTKGQYAALSTLFTPGSFLKQNLSQFPDAEMSPARLKTRGLR